MLSTQGDDIDQMVTAERLSLPKTLTLLLTWSPKPSNELSLAYTHALEESVKGQGSIPQAFGGGESNIRMRQDMLSAAYAWKF